MFIKLMFGKHAIHWDGLFTIIDITKVGESISYFGFSHQSYQINCLKQVFKLGQTLKLFIVAKMFLQFKLQFKIAYRFWWFMQFQFLCLWWKLARCKVYFDIFLHLLNWFKCRCYIILRQILAQLDTKINTVSIDVLIFTNNI